MNKNYTILVVDDEKSIRDTVRMMLQEDYKVITAKTGREAVEIAKKKPLDLVLLDIRLPELDGIETLKTIKEIDDSIDVIMITAVVTVGTAVQAMKIGAYDYITKPFDIDSIQSIVKNALEKRRLSKENLYLKSVVEAERGFEKIVGQSSLIKEIFSLIEDVSDNNSSTVLITGDSGTGKELVARAIHNRSGRKDHLFVTVNCAAIPENLIESELFGHEKGAFTGAMDRRIGKFELASGGTLFLDEISTLPFPMQAKLLRVIQEKEVERVGGSKLIPVDARIIAATNNNLKEMVSKGDFREDLFFRLNVIPINLPSLKERPEDIPLLINHFLNIFNKKFNKKAKGFQKDSLQKLMAYDWPGNVRELENLMERLVALSKEEYLLKEKLPSEILKTQAGSKEDLFDLSLKEASQRFESDFIKKAIQKAGGSKSKAAEILGIHRNTLFTIEKKNKSN
ncbi:MAG: sigma-54 dependent transcriptional regulator [Candidatus Margulisbacteria bacterium]|nr:sigma-54 dependent transcriptional regulator [Candidatus Margulisiibacteriota bacterium]MBU1021161.1 sigma-54 dependent transcriptional regulator [Candidatus Margulisiibacteriota bacterium]MBU1729767.1 sigma-54 dependent transcriptional regulator [Candidatus Margulisiibacteriota bacterium]MBU1955268.1 sigma-54 dependent transcriptional regulator [Candidatus Margulisiibacteriota bacterium]